MKDSDIDDPSEGSSASAMYRFNTKLWRVEELDLGPPEVPSKEDLERAEKNKKILAMFKKTLDYWKEQDRLEAEERKAQAVAEAENTRKPNLAVQAPDDDEKKEEESISMSSVGILNVPVEIMESICLDLDGTSVLHLKETCVQLERVVDEALSCKKGRKFWHRRSLEELLEKLMMRALVSFHTLVGVIRRRYYQPYIDTFPNNPKIYTWANVFKLVKTTQHKLETCPISMKILYRVQETLKNDVRLGFKKNARFGYPMVNVTTYGSLLIYDHVPCPFMLDMHHGSVFEDMEFQRRSYKILAKGERVLYTKFMDLPFENNSSDESLPQPITIMIIATVMRLCLFNTRDGERHCIDLPYPLPYALSERMPTLIATERDFLGFWVHPDSYRLYRIFVDPNTGTPDSELLQDLHLQGRMEQFWCQVRATAVEYIPLFERRSNRWEANCPVYTIVSPRLFNFTFLAGNGETDAQGRRKAIVLVDTPLYPKGAEFLRRKLKIIGQARGFGLVLFWSVEKLYALYDDIGKCYVYRDWPEYKFKFDKTQEVVKKAQVITENLMLMYTGDYILLSTVAVIPPIQHYRKSAMLDFGAIEMKLLRRIEMRDFTLSFPSPMEVKNFHFDFDKGTPYIFLMLDEPGTKSPYTYQLMKLEFRDPNSEKEPENVKEEPIYRNRSNQPRLRRIPENQLNKEVLAEVKDPRFIALLQAFGAYDSV